MTFRDFSEGVEEGKKWTKEEIGHLQEITGPHLCCMIAEECFPGLSTSSFGANLPHIFLNGPFTHPDIQLEKLASNTLRSQDDDCWLPSP
jgi:hypothetical protein